MVFPILDIGHWNTANVGLHQFSLTELFITLLYCISIDVTLGEQITL